MSVIALDVGFSHTGWTIFENGIPVKCGILETSKSSKTKIRVSDDYAVRSAKLSRDLAELILVNKVEGIVGELPSGGAQNAKANAQMMMALSIASSVASLLGKPAEWCTPEEVKKAVTGKRSATKREIMSKVISAIGGEIKKKNVKCRRSKNYPDGIRVDHKYVFCGQAYPEGRFEHIADSCGAYLALKNGNIIRMFGNERGLLKVG